MDENKARFSIISVPKHANITSRSKSIIKKQLDVEPNFTTDETAVEQNQHSFLQSIQSKIMQNYIVIWLKLNIHTSDENEYDSLIKLQRVVNTVEIFTDPNECVDFITNVKDEKMLMILSPSFGPFFISLIENIPQLYSIYVFDSEQIHDAQSVKGYRKVKGVFTYIESICNALKLDVSRITIDLTSFSIVSTTSTPNLDELDQSFMYTQLLKEIILDIEHNENAKQKFVDYCITRFQEQGFQPKSIAQFQKHYEDHSPIWWYTKEWFIYSTLNKALRTQDTETIIKMGFFLQDLHREIEEKYLQAQHTSKLVIYRGQGVPEIDFEKMKKNKGGLISFNNFLSTSTDHDVSFTFADSVRQDPDMIGVLFRMEIDPSIASTPYISLNDTSNFKSEDEILFSMHTIFRIGEMNEIDNRLWEVNLTLTSDDDPQLKYLTDYIREEIEVENGWYRLGLLMQKMGKFDKALEIFNILLKTTLHGDSDIDHLAWTGIYAHIGEAYRLMGDYSNAIVQLERALERFQDTLAPDHLMFATIYNNLGMIHQSMGNYAMALSYLEKALEIWQKSLPSDHPNMALNYNNIAMLHQSMGGYTMALPYLEKALEIHQKSLPLNHPNLALNYNNIAAVHQSMGNYAMALSYMEKALEIHRKSLPLNHPNLAVNYNNIAAVHQSMGNYAMALPYLEKALEIWQKSLPSGHPDIAVSYNNIALVHQLMGDYAMALSYLEKALEIWQKSLSSDYSNLALNYNNIASVHQSMGNYAMALPYLEKALEIWQKSLSSDHSNLALNYNNIAAVHQSMGNYAMALPYLEKALEIWQKSLPSGHPDIAVSYNNIASVHQLMGDYAVALSYLEKALEIQQKSFPSNHPHLTATYRNIASISQLKGDYTTAFSNWEKSLDIQQKSLSNNRSSHSVSLNNFEARQQQISCESTVMSQMKTLIETQQKLSLSNRPVEAWTDNDFDEAKNMLKTCLSLFSNIERALQIQQTTGRTDSLLIPNTYGNGDKQNQIIEGYLSTFSHLKKVLKKKQKLLTLDQAETADTDNDTDDDTDDETDESQSTTEDRLTIQSSLQKLFELDQKLRSPNDLSLAAGYNYIGNLSCSVGDYPSALSYFEKALGIIPSSLPSNHPLLAKTCSNMAKALDQLGRYKDAIDYARQAVDTARCNLESTNAEIEDYEQQLHQLQRKL